MDQVLVPRERSKKNILRPEMLHAVRLFKEKKQYKEIGKELNLTIGQVASFIRRARVYGLMKDLPPKSRKEIAKAGGSATATKAKKPIPERTTPFRPPSIEIEKPKRFKPVLIDSSTAVSFEELEPHHCRWPSGDPKRDDFRFCGKRRELPGPYCSEHTMQAVDKPFRRR